MTQLIMYIIVPNIQKVITYAIFANIEEEKNPRICAALLTIFLDPLFSNTPKKNASLETGIVQAGNASTQSLQENLRPQLGNESLRFVV